MKQGGIYLLFGEEEETGESLVYVGQAGARKNGEGILQRLVEHTKNEEKSYWREVVVLTTSNNSFGPTEISFLENSFCKLAKEANRTKVENQNSPNAGNITEEKECEMEEFIDQSLLLIRTLGYKAFDRIVTKTIEEGGEGLQLFLSRKMKKSGILIEAQCVRTKEGFTVLKGSRIEKIDSHAIEKMNTIKNAREAAKLDKNGILLEDITFSSPSYAGAFVIGNAINGQTEWKTKDGQSFLFAYFS